MARMIWFLVTLGFLFFVGIPALAFVLAIGSKGRDEKGRAAALASEATVLDEAFTGDVVTVKVSDRTLPFENYVVGGRSRGYSLLTQSDEAGGRKTLVFEKS